MESGSRCWCGANGWWCVRKVDDIGVKGPPLVGEEGPEEPEMDAEGEIICNDGG